MQDSLAPIYLVGPTAVGKSDVAARLAEKLGGEIVGADAYQVYRGLDLLTAKPDTAALGRVRHHLIGEVPLTENFDVARYRERATERIAAIQQAGRVPIVVGGTGLYVRALTHGLADLPESDPTLRERLTTTPLPELLTRLEELDPIGAQRIDRQNPRRVVRALEVCLLSGRPFSSFREQWDAPSEARGVVLVRDREELCSRIDRRTELMFAEGVVEEVRAVEEISATAAQAIGFRPIRALLAGELSRAACIAQIQQETRQYAKRQMTWFRREKHFIPVLRGAEESEEVAAEGVLRAIS